MARPPRPLAPDATVTFLDVGKQSPGSGTDQEGGGSLGGTLMLTRRFTVQIDDPACPLVVDMTIAARGGSLATETVTFRARSAGDAVTSSSVTSSSLRTVRLDAYLGEVYRRLRTDPSAMLLVVARNPAAPGVVSYSPVAPTGWCGFEASQRRRMPQATRLEQVAAVYRDALDSSDPNVAASPTEAVARLLHFSRGHAARLVSEARRAGVLGPAPGRGRAGELSRDGYHQEDNR